MNDINNIKQKLNELDREYIEIIKLLKESLLLNDKLVDEKLLEQVKNNFKFIKEDIKTIN